LRAALHFASLRLLRSLNFAARPHADFAARAPLWRRTLRAALHFASLRLLRSLNALPAILAWLVPLCVYAASARRDVWFWDTGEMDTVPWLLGIAHPAGFPAYVVIGYVFSHLVPFGSVALRMSLMSVLAMSVAAWLVARSVEDEGANAWIASACAWLFAFGSIAWTRATYAEVHALATCALAGTVFFALRWHRRGDARDLYAAAAVWGVGVAIHPVLLLALPALLFLAIMHVRASRPWEPLAAVAIAVVSASAWYAYLPLRSAYVSAHALDPTRLLGLPAGAPFWDYDHPASLGGFLTLVTGGAFDPVRALSGAANHAAHRLTLGEYAVEAMRELTPFGAAATAAGVCTTWMRDHVRAATLLLFGVPCIPFALGFPPESEPRRYLLASFVVAAIFAGDAAEFVAQRMPRLRALVTAALLVAAVALVVENRWIFAFAGDERARAVISDVQQRTPQDAVLVASWLDAPALAYAAYVERSLGGRIVVAAWIGDVASDVPAWRRTRPVFVVGPSNATSVAGLRIVALSPGSPVYRLARP
jgi:hypothetical protein